jgi:hypothetical protein
MFPEIVGSKNALKDLAAVSKGMAAQNADPFQKLQRGLDQIKETVGGPLVAKLNKFMDSLFSKKNAGPMKDAQGAISGMADAMGTFFGAIDGGGNAAKGFLKSVKTIADSIAISLETSAFYITLISGKKIKQGMFPALEGLGSALGVPGFKGSKSNTQSTGGFGINPHLQAAANGPLGFLVPQGKPTVVNNYSITSKTTDRMTAQEIIRMIQRYEKTTGKKYLGPTR